MKIQTLENSSLKEKNILVRCDFNIPLKRGKILDSSRLIAHLPTICFLENKGAKKIILISHLGRPEGGFEKGLILLPVAQKLKSLLGKKNGVTKTKLNSFDAYKISSRIFLLENIRFFKEEKENKLAFVKKLASLGDIFVMDAFSTAHRIHASVYGIGKILPAYAGLLMEKEISNLSRLTENPKHPFCIIMGGAKILEKINVISNLAKKADYFLLGGGISNAFLKAQGYEIGSSLYEKISISLCQKLLKKYPEKFILPIDFVAVDASKSSKVVKISFLKKKVKQSFKIVDIGPETIKKFTFYIKRAQTLLWNGPLGVYEKKKFAKGTLKIGRFFSEVSAGVPFGVVGGGDILAALSCEENICAVDYVSMGGGAMLKYLAGGKLPGLEILKKGK